MVVLLVLSILVVMSVIVFGSKNLFYADHQAYLLMDAIKEARQRAVTQRETLRLEVSREKREIRLINENESGDATDDVLQKVIVLADPKDLNFEVAPANMASAPVEPTPVPTAVFKASVHPLSTSENVTTLRFLKNGTVVDAGTDSIGTNSIVTGATFYFWKPKRAADGTLTDNGEVIRAITVLGSSGNAKYWRCPVENDQCSTWKQ